MSNDETLLLRNRRLDMFMLMREEVRKRDNSEAYDPDILRVCNTYLAAQGLTSYKIFYGDTDATAHGPYRVLKQPLIVDDEPLKEQA